MSNTRRGFLALVGGTGAFTGSVLFRKAAAAPTLILPPEMVATDAEQPVQAQPSEPEMQAVLDVKSGLSHAMFVDWLESGLRLVEDCKPEGGIFGAYWREAERGQIPAPPKRRIGNGGRTAHEEAYLRQSFDNVRGSLEQQIAWSKALPIRQGGGA